MEDGIERKWLTLSQREMFQSIDINHVQMENLEKINVDIVTQEDISTFPVDLFDLCIL